MFQRWFLDECGQPIMYDIIISLLSHSCLSPGNVAEDIFICSHCTQ